MRDARDWDEAYLQELIAIGEQESLTLDYKASADLAKDNSKRNSISKDVSAFANSAGGFLVYGMLENKHVPTNIDVGVDRNVITKEWLESVIKSVIQPVVDDVVIKAVDLPANGADKVIYVVQIPQATSRAPTDTSTSIRLFASAQYPLCSDACDCSCSTLVYAANEPKASCCMQIQRDGTGQPYIEREQARGHDERACIQRKSDPEKDWASTRAYLNVVRCNSPGHPGGNATDFPIFNSNLSDEQILEAFVQATSAVTGCSL